jgi:hypothetical protein
LSECEGHMHTNRICRCARLTLYLFERLLELVYLLPQHPDPHMLRVVRSGDTLVQLRRREVDQSGVGLVEAQQPLHLVELRGVRADVFVPLNIQVLLTDGREHGRTRAK